MLYIITVHIVCGVNFFAFFCMSLIPMHDYSDVLNILCC